MPARFLSKGQGFDIINQDVFVLRGIEREGKAW
jgi:hypothetical protein